MEKERFKKLFPRLAEEIESGKSRVRTADIEGVTRQREKDTNRKWTGHNPDVVDFIRRCSTKEEAEEIIGYMEKRGEITPDRVAELRRQLHEKGLDSFGNRKEANFYHKNR